MFNNRFKFDATADLAKSILEADTKAKMEELKGKQTKLDKNHNGKLDAQDFKMLRGEKKVNEAEADYQSSYRVGKVANFKPKASDVGQGRKISGKMGKYGKQPDDDNMVEPPPEHKVGDVKTDPSAVVPGHSTMGAKLHLASLPKDAEGNTIHKGARRVNAADLVAKRKAMMSQKNEAVEDTLHPAGAALLKHIKPQHHNLYKAHLTKDVFNGGFGDRHAVLKAAQDAGHLKMDLKKQNEGMTEASSDDELNSRPGMWRGDAKRMTAKGKPTKDELGMQNNLKNRIKASNKKGGLTGPKGSLPEQNEEVESINEEDPYIGSKEERSEIWTKHAHAAHNGDDHEEEKISRHARNLFGKHFAHDMEQHSNHYVMKNKFSDSRGEERDHISQMDKLAKRQHVDNEHLKHDHLVKESLEERTLTSGETKEKERIVHGMKKSLKGFKARYGDRAKEVMYATATKQAKKD